jgi:hypothetical protein
MGVRTCLRDLQLVASCFSMDVLVAGGFSCQQSVAAVPQGLLIPRSQVRILSGPLETPCKTAISVRRNRRSGVWRLLAEGLRP